MLKWMNKKIFTILNLCYTVFQVSKKTAMEATTKKSDVVWDFDAIYVFSTDSVGNDLRPRLPMKLKKTAIWLSYEDSTVKQSVDRIIDRFPSLLKQYKDKNIKLIFWHGFCDLINKNGKKLTLKSKPCKDILKALQVEYYRLIDFLAPYRKVNLYMLEMTPVNLTKWNKFFGVKDNTDDNIVGQYIRDHNSMIKSLNRHVGFFVCPWFGRHMWQKRQGMDFSMTMDGIHPVAPLAKKWLHDVLNSVNQKETVS